MQGPLWRCPHRPTWSSSNMARSSQVTQTEEQLEFVTSSRADIDVALPLRSTARDLEQSNAISLSGAMR